MKEATRKTMFSSVRMDWATPMDFFNALDAEFHFTLDPCASPENAKCKILYRADKRIITELKGRNGVL